MTKFVYQRLRGQVIQELNSSNAVIRSDAWDSLGRQLYIKTGSSAYYQITDLPGGNVSWDQHHRRGRDPCTDLTYTPPSSARPIID